MIEVIKFGGNTLNDEKKINLAIDYLKEKVKNNIKLIVVTSAFGRLGEPYATDTLKLLLKKVVKNEEYDRLLSIGEIISSIVLSNYLQHENLKATSISTKELGLITNCEFGDSTVLEIKSNLTEYLKDNDIVVVPGFQGVTADGKITTLGRGGSDYTASILANKYGAVLEIISDVSGIYSVDPKIVKTAKLIPKITHRQLLNISQSGSKIMHAKGAEYCLENKINFKFCSLNNLDDFTINGENNDFFNITYSKEENSTITVFYNGEKIIHQVEKSNLYDFINHLHNNYISL